MTTAPTSRGSFREGDTVGKYLIIRLLGQGATANVWLATNTEAGRFVAVKAIRPELSGQASVREMFLFEARLLTQFDHDNVVRAIEVGEYNKDPFLVLEYLDGAPLHQIIGSAAERGAPIPLPVVATLIDGALAGLQAVHTSGKKGVVHCDISPYNLFVTYEGATKLIDFGIARVGTKAQRSLEVRGRYAYMSPEQALGRPFDARADVFSIGVVLWEILARQRLFRKQDDETTKQALLTMRVPRLSEVSDIDLPGLDDIINMALQRDPSIRFDSTASMAAAMRQVIEQHMPYADPSEVAGFCSNLLGGSLLTPGMTSLAPPPMRPRAFSIEIPSGMSHTASAPALPILDEPYQGFGGRDFGAPPAFAQQAQLPSSGAGMFEDEFTTFGDGVVGLRGAPPPNATGTFAAMNQTPGSITASGVHTHTPIGRVKKSEPNWGLLVASCVLLCGVGGGVAYWLRDTWEHDEFDSEPAALPVSMAAASSGLTAAGADPHAALAPGSEVVEELDGFLAVHSPTPATVYVDGKKIGRTPIQGHVLSAGPHPVQLLADDGSTLFADNVEIKVRDTATVNLDAEILEQ